MSTDLEQRLRDMFHEDAERARLVNVDGPPAPEARPLGTVEPSRWSARRVAAIAAVMVLIAIATAAVLSTRSRWMRIRSRRPPTCSTS